MIDSTWTTIIETPPFPEYTSTHSIQAGAAAAVMTDLLGDNVPFTDYTHYPCLPARSFASFNAAGYEAAISRVYAGIHYKDTIERALEQGRGIAEVINRLRFQK